MEALLTESGSTGRAAEPDGDAPLVWEERITRGVAVALMSNFTSVAEALKELVDNPIDYRDGQPLDVEVSVDDKRDRIVVESDGGRGMGAEEINVWLNWGEGELHDASHIGRYHQGGKAACGFLGERVRLWGKRSGSDDVWYFEDDAWATRTVPKSFGQPRPIAVAFLPTSMQTLDQARGHVHIEILQLRKGYRRNLEHLRRALASTYRSLLINRRLRLTVGGEEVNALEIPLSTATKRVEINAKLASGRSAEGWAGRMKREQLGAPLKSGLRLLHNGRLIYEGEWFGYNHEGKGALNSLIGELHLKNFTPLPNKTDFGDRGHEVWDELRQKVLGQLQPLISELRKPGEEYRVSKQEKRTAKEVAEELGRVFSSFAEPASSAASGSDRANGSEIGPGGRRPVRSGPCRLPVTQPRGPNTKAPEPRTDPPLDAVGGLARLISRITDGSYEPPIRIRAWDQNERSAWVTEAGKQWLDINKHYPLYRALAGTKPYVAETAILEVCRRPATEVTSADAYLDRVNLLLFRWASEAGYSHLDDGLEALDGPSGQ